MDILYENIRSHFGSNSFAQAPACGSSAVAMSDDDGIMGDAPASQEEGAAGDGLQCDPVPDAAAVGAAPRRRNREAPRRGVVPVSSWLTPPFHVPRVPPLTAVSLMRVWHRGAWSGWLAASGASWRPPGRRPRRTRT